MKKTIFILILLISFFDLKSQKVSRLGVHAGYNSTSLETSNYSSEGYNSFGGGLMNELKFPSKLGLSSEINYFKKGAIIGISSGNKEKLVIHSMDFPSYIKYHILKVVNVYAGLKASWLLFSAKYDGESVKKDINTGDFSLIYGFGVDVGKVHAKVMYGYGFYGTNFYDKIDNVLPDYLKDYTFNTFRIDLGFWLWEK